MTISSCIPEECLPYVKASGHDLLERIGSNQLRSIMVGVLCGENVRTATEPLTKRRIAILNAAIVITLVRACQQFPPDDVLRQAHDECLQLKKNDPRRTILMWILGLTEKQVQNVLRSDESAWVDFVRSAGKVVENAASYSAEVFGNLEWTLEADGVSAQWDWLWAHLLMGSVGTQSLATRGSEKSMYGKLFEKLVLSSALSMLGFQFDGIKTGKNMTFWLSEQGDKRESDATAIIGNELGIRFDIGFIGPGNTEITLDKVSRFERIADISGKDFKMQTIIIVDRIGEKSQTVQLAEAINGKVLQMSSALWIIDLDRIIGEYAANYKQKFNAKSTVKDVKEQASKLLDSNQLEQLLRIINM